MTAEEKQEIINAVLSAIRTNSKTISQLTPVTNISNDDYIELSSGNRVSYYTLYEVLLAAIEIVVQGNIDTMYDAISNLSERVVKYADVGELIPELSGQQILAFSQSPFVVFKSMGAAYDGVSRTVTLNDGEASYSGSGVNYSYNHRGNVGLYPVVPNKAYFNAYTGRLYRWTGSSFETVGGGIDGAIFDVIKNNVNLVAAKLDSLISALAMLAFSNTVDKNTLKVGELSWVEPETHEPRITSPINGSTVDFGSTAIQTSRTISIQGADLTKSLTLAITSGAQQFRLSGNISSISASEANNGKNISVIYTPSSSVQNAAGTLRIYSDEVDITVNLSGAYSEQGGGETSYQVAAGTLSHVQITETLPATVSSGGSFTGHLVADSGYSLPSSIAVSGTHGTVSYDQSTGAFTIPNITSNVAISASAAASTIKVVYKLLNFNNPSDATQDGTFGYYNETIDKDTNFSKPLSVVSGATLRGLVVKSGGNIVSGATYSNGTLSIPKSVLETLTHDIIVEATAYTGTVTIVANAEVTGGVTFNGTTAQDLSNGTNTFSYDTISSLSFSSAAKTAITSIDFGGATFTGTSLASMFSGFTAVTHIKGLVVTSSVTSLAYMFSGCTLLQEFDTIGWDTSHVTSIIRMAYSCTALTKVDLGSKDMGLLVYAGANDDTGPVFYNCSNLVNLDVSYWDAPNLVSVRGFVYSCTSLRKFDASTWNAPNVANLHGMFASCSSLEEVDISGIDTHNADADQNTVVQITHMFHLSNGNTDCGLRKLTIGRFDTSSVKSLESLFWRACGEHGLELHCKSTDVPSISSDASKIWFKAGNTSASNLGKQMVGSIYVPDECLSDYQTAWSAYLDSETTWHEE